MRGAYFYFFCLVEIVVLEKLAVLGLLVLLVSPG